MRIFAETHQPVSCQSNQPHFCTPLLFQRLPEVNIQVTAGFISKSEFPARLSVICSAYTKMSQFVVWKTRNGINTTHPSDSHIQTLGTPCKYSQILLWNLGQWWDFLGAVYNNNNNVPPDSFWPDIYYSFGCKPNVYIWKLFVTL